MGVTDLPFVGRSVERRRLRDVLDPAKAGIRLAIVRGPAGVGKTRLVEEALRDRRERVTVVRTAAHALDEDQPFAAVSGLIDAAQDSSLREPMLRGAPEFVDRAIRAVEQRGRSGPLLVVAEDFHWADPASWRVVRSLAALPAAAGVSLIIVVRTPVGGDAATQLDRLRAYGAVDLELTDLDESDARSLVASQLSAAAHAHAHDATSVIERAGGNPLFLTELLRAVAAPSTDARTDAPRAVPSSLRVAVMARLASLTQAERRLLSLASLLGTRFSVDELAHVADRPVLAVVDDLHAALAQGVLREEGHELAFSHALVGDCIRDDQPVAFRNAVHRHIAGVLAGRGASAQRVAEHYVLAATGETELLVDEEAATWLARASADAQASSLPTATNLLERALRLTPSGPARGQRRFEIASLYLLGGRLAEAEMACRSLLDDPDHRDDPRLECSARSLLAAVFALRGPLHAGAAVQEFDAVAALSAPDGRAGHDRSLIAEALAAKALVVLYTGDIAAAKGFAHAAIDEATASGNRSARSRAHEALALAALVSLDVEEAKAHVQESLAWFSPSNGVWSMVVTPHLTASMVLVSLGELDAADRVCRVGLDVCTASGHLMPRLYLLPCLAVLRLLVGDLDEALRLASLTNELIDDWCPTHASPSTRAIVGYVRWLRGDGAAGQRDVEKAAAEMWDSGAQVSVADLNAWLIASVLEGMGRRRDAFDLLHLVWQLIGAATGGVVMAADLVRIARDEQPELAAEVAAQLRQRSETAPVRRNQIVARRAAALLDDDADALRKVVADFDANGSVLSAAWSARDLAVVLAGHGERDAAEAAIRDAIRRFDAMDAPVASSELRALARSLGIAMRPLRSRAGGLTETERLVAVLAREGLSNREIGERLHISPRTAESHLTRVFAKLGVRNRVQLAAAMAGAADL